MFCNKCGEPTVQNAKFCANCGAILLPLAPSTSQLKTMTDIENISAQSRVRPWVRHWARMLDVYSFSLVGGAILGFSAPQFLARQNEYAKSSGSTMEFKQMTNYFS